MNADKRLRAALQAVFTPLARVLIRHGVAIRSVVDILKVSYVKAAIAEIESNSGFKSNSQIARLTGLSRKTVTKIRYSNFEPVDLTSIYALDFGDLLTYWSSSPAFVDRNGQPRILEIDCGPNSFADLVELRLGAVDIESVLSVLSEAGNTLITTNRRVILKSRVWHNIHDLPMLLTDMIGTSMSTLEKSQRNPEVEDRLCHLTAFTRSMDPEKLDIARRSIREKTRQFAREIDDYLAAMETNSQLPMYDRIGNELLRLGVGVYYFELDK